MQQNKGFSQFFTFFCFQEIFHSHFGDEFQTKTALTLIRGENSVDIYSDPWQTALERKHSFFYLF